MDVTRQVMSDMFITFFNDMIAIFKNASATLAQLEASTQALLGVIDDLDQLLNTNEHFLLGRWIQSARNWGSSAQESDWLEFNARNQVTLWGPDGEINDYASKQWAGLVGVYYKQRWTIFADALISAKQAGQVRN